MLFLRALEPIVRTIVYVDGFNLYYGALKGSAHKWLDLKSLFAMLLRPENQIVCIKYFTARVSNTTSDPHKSNHQDAYLRALQYAIPEIRIYFGQFTTHVVQAKLATPIDGVRYANVLRTSEKGSDVNLAVHLVNDAWLDAFDCAVVVSRDSDLAESMSLVKTFHSQKKLGLITMGRSLKTSKELLRHADFVKAISSSTLSGAQFPEKIPGTNISKPPDW